MLAAVRHLFIFIKEDLCTMNVEARLWGLIYMNYLLFSDKHCIFFVHTLQPPQSLHMNMGTNSLYDSTPKDERLKILVL